MRRRSLVQACTTILLAAAGGQVASVDAANPYTEQAPRCIVPALHGKSLQTAKTTITKAHCRLGVVRRRTAPKALFGKVVSQSPAAAKRLEGGTFVRLTLGRAAR
jgi:beta-lactam-binding protein with PASTA domain